MRLALTELNLRITLRKDRDHQIVQRKYFMNVADEESFNRTFRRQIIPLLQEYFYNHWQAFDMICVRTHSRTVISHLQGGRC